MKLFTFHLLLRLEQSTERCFSVLCECVVAHGGDTLTQHTVGYVWHPPISVLSSSSFQGLAPAPSSLDCQSALFSDQPFLSFILPFIRSLLCSFPRHTLPVSGKLVIANVIKEKPSS